MAFDLQSKTHKVTIFHENVYQAYLGDHYETSKGREMMEHSFLAVSGAFFRERGG